MYQRVTIKVGSNVLTGENGTLDEKNLERIVNQVVELRKKSIEVILVSSGAVAAGRGFLKNGKNLDTVSGRQLYSAVGQVHLMNTYSSLLAKNNLSCAQVLVTKEDFRDRVHYVNLKNCMSVLLNHGIIPIINENDTISVNELMFTDNDELSGMIAAMSGAEALFILTNVDGIYTGNPADENSELIREANSHHDLSKFISATRSDFGRGGMVTKYNMAQKVSRQGITVYIANGRRDLVTLDIVNQLEVPCTRFDAEVKKSTVKKWIAHSVGFEKGTLVINEGARSALLGERARSLLPVGVIQIDGDFHKGDIVKIIDEEGRNVGLGKAMYGAETARQKVGIQGEKPIIHYDYLYLEN